ncbi:hypothetical protein [Deinococcus sp.]|uniref:hypothetical protein n=1 Tax=Deinococcus sp. TaxID=47478 RepID=UPI002869C26E|nr:hypothetical protein [Deinococcus sp.]
MALGNQEAAVEFGNFLRATGQNRRAVEHFRDLLPTLSGELRYRGLRWYGVTLEQMGEDGAMKAMEEARRGYLSIGDRRMAARITHTLAASHTVHGDYNTAMKLLDSAIPTLAEESNQRPLMAAFCTLADVQVECGQYDSAAETLERAQAIAEGLQDAYMELHLDARHANIMLMTGDYGSYQELLESLADRSAAMGEPQVTEHALNHLANHQSRIGEHALAVRTMGRLRASTPNMSLHSRVVLGMMTLRRGDAASAHRMLMDVRDEALRRSAMNDATRALLLAAYSAYAMNDLARCSNLLSEALMELSALPRAQTRATIAPELREIEEMLAFARLSPNLAPLLEAALEDASHLSGNMRDDLFTSVMRLEVMTLGQELVLRDGVPCTMRVRGSVAVLTYLAMHPRSTRQTVITDVWPDRDPKKAATYFRQCIADIREAIGADVILVEGAHQSPEYRLSSKATVILDSQRVLQLVANGQLPAAIAAYKGAFLPNLDGSEWADEQRIHIREALLGSLHGELRAARLGREHRRVVLLATAILEIDPSDMQTEELRLDTAREVSGAAEVARFEAERHRRMN